MLFLFLYFGLKNYPQTYQDDRLVSILMEDGLSLFCAYLVWIFHLKCTIVIYTLNMLTPCIICKFVKIYWKFFLPTKKKKRNHELFVIKNLIQFPPPPSLALPNISV